MTDHVHRLVIWGLAILTIGFAVIAWAFEQIELPPAARAGLEFPIGMTVLVAIAIGADLFLAPRLYATGPPPAPAEIPDYELHTAPITRTCARCGAVRAPSDMKDDGPVEEYGEGDSYVCKPGLCLRRQEVA